MAAYTTVSWEIGKWFEFGYFFEGGVNTIS